jgi:hypothetical protein
MENKIVNEKWNEGRFGQAAEKVVENFFDNNTVEGAIEVMEDLVYDYAIEPGDETAVVEIAVEEIRRRLTSAMKTIVEGHFSNIDEE